MKKKKKKKRLDSAFERSSLCTRLWDATRMTPDAGKSEITAETSLSAFYVQSHRVFMSPVWATIVSIWKKKKKKWFWWGSPTTVCGLHDWNADATLKLVQWNTQHFLQDELMEN